MYIRFTLITLLLLSASAQASTEWMTDVDRAFATALAEQRTVLVHVRSRCKGACNAKADKMLAAIDAQPLVAHLLPSVVLLRVEEEKVRGPVVELNRKTKPPFVSIVDATGQQIHTFHGEKLNLQVITAALQDVHDSRSLLARSALQRKQGNVASAEYLLGHAFLRMRGAFRAAEKLELAAAAFRKAGDEAMAQYATIDAGFAWYAAYQRPRALRMIADVMEKPVNATVEANGWYMRGAMERMNTRNAVAIKNFRKAYELAPIDSEVFALARDVLRDLDPNPLPPKEGITTEAVVRLMPPARRTVTGHAEFAAEVRGEASRVEFYLDGTRAATDDKAPYRSKLDLGPTPRARTVKAVAYDASNRAIGEAVVIVNDRADAFRINITMPVGPRVLGTTVVETDVVVPPGRTLQRVELYWKDDLVANLTAPPLRHALRINGEFGYLRAVALLDDGTAAEETKLFNVEGSTELVDVSAVNFIATVLNDAGNPVPGLTAKDFAVEEEQRRVDVNVRQALDEPVTIGVAIDSSSSMSRYVPFVGMAASKLVESTVREQDRAFVVSFDSAPRLIHPRSNDVASMRSAIFELRNLGGTSIYDGVTFALQQFQEISGRRVLVILSDGQEGKSSGNADACVRLAKTIGVPIYALIPRGGQRLLNPLTRLAELTGGESTVVSEETLTKALERIAAEIRGQYLLSFQAPNAPSGSWRELTVRTPKGKVRTITGYYAK
ncbi:MAG TPA: VWA domain-containing protein [Thermoanaerobaculia bacterium]